MRAAPDPSRRRAAALLATLLACAPATKLPASDAAPGTSPAPAVDAAPVTSPAPAVAQPPSPAPPPEAAPPPARECRNGERLDSGCECRSGGACFDICCGPGAGCAHPAQPGGRSACLLQAARPPAPAPAEPATTAKQKPCTDGQFLSDGCKCEGKTCMDLCCVGSICSHHSSPSGGHARCMSRR